MVTTTFGFYNMQLFKLYCSSRGELAHHKLKLALALLISKEGFEPSCPKATKLKFVVSTDSTT
jgi:hypothetical protein